MENEKLYNLNMTVFQFYCTVSEIHVLQHLGLKKILLHRPVELGRELSTSDASLTDKLRGKHAPSFVFPVALCFLKSCRKPINSISRFFTRVGIIQHYKHKAAFSFFKIAKAVNRNLNIFKKRK